MKREKMAISKEAISEIALLFAQIESDAPAEAVLNEIGAFSVCGVAPFTLSPTFESIVYEFFTNGLSQQIHSSSVSLFISCEYT